jgi:hypothetical protein
MAIIACFYLGVGGIKKEQNNDNEKGPMRSQLAKRDGD